jgi:hypothetical protein
VREIEKRRVGRRGRKGGGGRKERGRNGGRGEK